MTSKQLLRLAAVLALVLVLWGAVALASRRGSEVGSIIPKVDTSNIDTVAITGPHDTAMLVRTGAKGIPWRVNGHAADTQVVRELLGGLADPDANSELVAQNPASHERLRVTDDSGKRVRVMEKGRTLLDLVAGKQTTDGEGVYVRRSGEPAVYALAGELAKAITRRVDDWRNHLIGGVLPDSVGSVEIRRGGRSYTLRRKGTGWVFAAGAGADSAAVARLLGSYREIRADGFGTKAQLDSLRFTRPKRTARLLGRDGAPLLSLAFDSIASGIWVRVSKADRRTGGQAENEAFRLDAWTADQLTPADTSLRKK
jgi:Domain of unknown function (DUF4340)